MMRSANGSSSTGGCSSNWCAARCSATDSALGLGVAAFAVRRFGWFSMMAFCT